MSSNVNIVPLESGNGVFLPKDGGIELVETTMSSRGNLDFYQNQFGIDLYRPLPAGKTEVDVVGFTSGVFQFQATPDPCDEWEDHGGSDFAKRTIKTCRIGHFHKYCPDHLIKCYTNLINPHTNDEYSGSFNMLRASVSDLASGLLPKARPYNSIAGLFNPDNILDSDGNFLVVNKPSNVNDKVWNQFKTSIKGVKCRGWAAKVKHYCDGLFDDLKGKIGECKTVEKRAELLNDLLAQLLCCAESIDQLNEGLTTGLYYRNEKLQGYVRVSPAIYSIAKQATFFNKSKQNNGCTSVCSNFNYDDINGTRVIYWGEYKLVPDPSLCMWDSALGGTTYAAYFTLDKVIQFSTSFAALDGVIPVDYQNYFEVKDYQAPVLQVYPTEKNGGVKWSVKTSLQTGAEIASEDLIVGAICIVPKK